MGKTKKFKFKPKKAMKELKQFCIWAVIFCGLVIGCYYTAGPGKDNISTNQDSIRADSIRIDSLNKVREDSISRAYENSYHINGELIPQSELPQD
jgi:hypothetical protein